MALEVKDREKRRLKLGSTQIRLYEVLMSYPRYLRAAAPLDVRDVGGPRCGRRGGLQPVHEAEVNEFPIDEDVTGVLVVLVSLVVEVDEGHTALLVVAQSDKAILKRKYLIISH